MSNIVQFKPRPPTRAEMEYKFFCEMRDRDMERRQHDDLHQKAMRRIHFIGATICMLVGAAPSILFLLGFRP